MATTKKAPRGAGQATWTTRLPDLRGLDPARFLGLVYVARRDGRPLTAADAGAVAAVYPRAKVPTFGAASVWAPELHGTGLDGERFEVRAYLARVDGGTLTDADLVELRAAFPMPSASRRKTAPRPAAARTAKAPAAKRKATPKRSAARR